MLDDRIFNIHDIVLVLVVFESIAFSLLLLAVREGRVLSCRLLSLFLLAIGAESLDTVLYWCAPLKANYLADQTYLFLLIKSAPFLQGPLLYFYTRSVLYGEVGMRRWWLHFTPFMAFPLYLLVMHFELGSDGVVAGVFKYGIWVDSFSFSWINYAPSALVLFYTLASIKAINEYVEGLKQTYSNVDKIDRNWLKLLIYGFLFTWCWNFVNIIFASLHLTSISAFFGLSGNYYDLIFVKALAFYNLLYSRMALGKRRDVDATEAIIEEDKAPLSTGGHSQTEQSPAPAAPVTPSESARKPAGDQPKAPASQGNPVATQSEPKSATAAAPESLQQDSERHDELDEIPKALSDKLVRLMEEEEIYLNPELTVDQLARAARLPSRQTSNIINRKFNMNFFEFVNHYRVEHAKRLLANHLEYSVIEISEMSGFNSKSAFNRFFKKVTGVTPTEHRKSSQID